MIEKFWLPYGTRAIQFANEAFRGPLFPLANEGFQAGCILFRGTKEMDVVRHDYESGDVPAMTNGGSFPFGF